MEAAQKVALEPLASALGVAAFLHNVIIVHPIISLVAECFFMHYNATLCKEAWGKKFAHGVLICFLKEFAVAGGRSGASCEAYVFFLKTVPVIFLERWQRSGI